MFAKIKTFFINHEYKIILILGFIIVASISFEAGMIRGSKIGQNPVKIEQVTSNQDSAPQEAAKAQNLASEAVKTGDSANTPAQTMPGGRQDCAYVGSKNSNKYHLPTCQYAKRIKPENTVCFKDENEAKLRGYLPDKGCIK